jgi:hypothetical protein
MDPEPCRFSHDRAPLRIGHEYLAQPLETTVLEQVIVIEEEERIPTGGGTAGISGMRPPPRS